MTDALRADLNDFLFTPIADDPNGMHLTMLSALARSGVDPWEAAAGLRALSREDAAERLVRMLADVPHGPLPGNDTATVVARLMTQLHSSPTPKLRPVSSTAAVASGSDEPPLLRSFSALPTGVRLMIYSLVALVLIILGYRALNGSDPEVSDGVDHQRSGQRPLQWAARRDDVTPLSPCARGALDAAVFVQSDQNS